MTTKKDVPMAVLVIGWKEYYMPAKQAYVVHEAMMQSLEKDYEFFGNTYHHYIKDAPLVEVKSLPQGNVEVLTGVSADDRSEYSKFLRASAEIMGDKYKPTTFEDWKKGRES